MSEAEEALRRAAGLLGELDAAAGSYDPAEIYGAIAEVAARRLPGVRSASVTTWDGRRYATAAATDEDARRADQHQYDSGAGPVISAIQDGGAHHGPGSSALRLADGRPAAALNLYPDEPDEPHERDRPGPAGQPGTPDRNGALPPETLQLAVLLAAHARLALAAAENAVRAANLERSRVTGQQIGAAVGLLMAVKRISHDEARDLLRTTSQRANRRVSDLAAEVVATGSLPPTKKIGPRRRDQPGDQPKRPEM